MYGVEFAGTVGVGGTTVAVVDIASGWLRHEVECAPFNRLHGLAMDDRGRLYVLSEEKSVLLVVESPGKDKRPTSAVATGDVKPHMFALSEDGERAYVTALFSNTLTLVRPHEPAATLLQIVPGAMPEGVCLGPDERRVYVTNRRSATLAALNSQTLNVEATVKTRADAPRGYSVQDELWVSNLADQSVSIYSQDLREIAHLPLGGRPIGVAFSSPCGESIRVRGTEPLAGRGRSKSKSRSTV